MDDIEPEPEWNVTPENGLHVKLLRIVCRFFTHTARHLLMYIVPNSPDLAWNGAPNNYFSGPLTRHFRIKIYICSIFYLGRVQYRDLAGQQHVLEHLTDDQVNTYWTNEAQHQLGTHVFVSRYGTLYAIITCVAQRVRETIYDPILYDYTPRIQTSITAIYPVVRMDPVNPDPDQIPDFHLTLGLRYQDYRDQYGLDQYGNAVIAQNPYFNVGDRHYHRLRNYTNPCNFGGVFEILANDLNNSIELTNQSIANQVRCCALYVCAGAKLVVYDQYNPVINNRSHNRSLLQQGGFVIVENCRLLINVNFEHYFNYEFQTALNNGILCGPALPPNGIENPVIFLAPNESEYQSIAWNLSIKRNSATHDVRDCILLIPEGGRIAAIENWVEGMAEVRARFRYERLHRSVVRMDNVLPEPGFQVPPEPMLRKILGMAQGRGIDRQVYCNIFADNYIYYNYQTSNIAVVPKQYNTYRCIDFVYNDIVNNSEIARVAPMYPPIRLEPGKDIQFMPSVDTIDAKLHNFRNPKLQIIEPFYITRTTLPNGHLKEWFYEEGPERVIEERPMKKMQFGTIPHNLDGHNYRLGIDGWFYEYDLNADIQYRFKSVVFERMD